MNKIRLYKSVVLSIAFIMGISIIILYILYLPEIKTSISQTDGVWNIITIMGIRIFIESIMIIYIFRQWFKQEAQYISDIPFLFGLLFLMNTYGKILELLVYLTYNYLESSAALNLLKFRYCFVILEYVPMLFLSFKMILYRYSLHQSSGKILMEKYRNKLSGIILMMILSVESIFLFIMPSVRMVAILLPFIVFPALIMIVWLFYFAHRNKALQQVNSLILIIGFLMWLITSITRPLLHNILGENVTYVILAEILELFFVILIVFIGLYKKRKL